MAMGWAPKCHFVLGFQSGSLEIFKVGTPTTLGAYNFVWKTFDWNEVLRKVVSLFESFPMVCHMPPTRKEIMVILDF
jgi:hypothetical protein